MVKGAVVTLVGTAMIEILIEEKLCVSEQNHNIEYG